MLSLAWAGLDQNIIYYIILSYIAFALSFSLYKSNNKFKQLTKFAFNIGIITIFWRHIVDFNCIGFIIIVMHNNIILTLNDWESEWDFDLDL